MLIVLEGLDGSGKSTAIRVLKRLLADRDPLLILEPGGDLAFAQDMREFIFAHINDGLDPLTELLLFQAVRNELYSKEVIPALQRGRLVLSDRNYISSIVYQGYARYGADSHWLDAARKVLEVGVKAKPDVVLFMDVPIDRALACMSDDDPFKRKGAKYWANAAHGYREVMRSGEFNVYRIDADQDLESVERQLAEFAASLADV